MQTQSISRVTINGSRHYQVEGYPDPFPSVTTVLSIINKPALVPWARNVALDSMRQALIAEPPPDWSLDGGMVADERYCQWVEEVIAAAKKLPDQQRTQAADFGTQAHVLIDAIIRGLEPEIPPEMAPVVASFQAWRDGAGLDLHLTETMVYSARHGYAGAMDALAYRDGKLVALDWKTSNGIYPEYALQVAAYAKAIEEMTGESVSEAWAVRLGKKAPEFEARKVEDIDRAFNAFLAALDLWRGMQQVRL